ncbi:UDP-N-acetylmuramoyl-L-alanyl-D-glutamate--2,6-diaminopimelate ligase [Ihubacter sp. mB4P-1]|uniref:UDP-N-acetylmuramoyl-L-alanyl-D-glutamate--2, 6-diaminopimelate ligase n=1 Tax=Ihubacter sp. mB4P-1 TaxID=3242370 RepID=UPI003C7ACCF9
MRGKTDCEITALTEDSRQAEKGAMFFCIKGCLTDGHDYADDAVFRGASAIVCDREISLPADCTTAVLMTDDVRKAMGAMASAFYGWPHRELITVGVTGTKGKTTTTFMIKKILDEAGIKTGLIGTIVTDTGKDILKSDHTTPDSIRLHRYLREMASNGCKAAVIEVSSQALKLSRTEPVIFDYGVFTNIEEDHISPFEHKDFAEYASCKARLFRRCGIGLVNGDDPNIELITKNASCRLRTFGFEPGNDLRAESLYTVRLPGALGSEFRLRGKDFDTGVVLGMPGKFNCSNAMAAISTALLMGVPEQTASAALQKISVPGRQEMFALDAGRLIMVDYAHNGTGLKQLLTSLREYRPSRVTCVFGCGGNRDFGRRKAMGEAAAKYADRIIVTSDNPRNEQPQAIINDIITEIEKYNTPFQVIEDRGQAIEEAVRSCVPGEIAAICGKGHEDYQILGDEIIHFDDREQVLASIEKVRNEQNYNCGNQRGYGRTNSVR